MKPHPFEFQLPGGPKCSRSVKGGILFLAILAIAIVPGQVLGHSGGEPVVSEAIAGPYLLYVWLSPVPAVAGEQHITISVNAPASDNSGPSEPILDANVMVTASATADPELTIAAPALHQQAANKLFYEARLNLVVEGTWKLTIDIVSDLGSGSYEMPLDIENAMGKGERSNFWQRFTIWLSELFSRS